MDFDKKIDRINTHSMKWDYLKARYGLDPHEALPMWVADMEFAPPPSVALALKARLDHGIFGYFGDPAEYRQALCAWTKNRHGFDFSDHFTAEVHGLVQAVAVCLTALTNPGDGVIVFAPIYHAFGRVVRANGRDLVECPLRLHEGRYMMDLGLLQSMLKGHERLILLSSPHNPGGRVWSEAELRALADFAKMHNLIIISDEIHMDLTLDGVPHHVFGKVAPDMEESLIHLVSATKAFNIAGALTGSLLTRGQKIADKIQAVIAAQGISPNLFGMIAATAAYQDGAEWMTTLQDYLSENARIFDREIEKITGAKSMRLEATYLAWVDFRDTGIPPYQLYEKLEQKAKIAASHGEDFGLGGSGFVRFNFAMPRAALQDALGRILEAFGA